MAKQAATASERLDQRLAAAALEKGRKGEKPTKQEASALRRIEKAREERDRERFYRSVPKRHFLAMAGRQANSINVMGRTWAMPVFGREVNLYEFVPWVFNFLAENKHALKSIREGTTANDPSAQADVGYKHERMLLLRNRRQQQEGTLLSRVEVHEGLAAISGIYRRAGERLRREFGDEAYQIIHEGWDDADRKIEVLFGEGNGEKES
ncbi:MAG: hypothetical protein ACYSWU_14125 [Planctomycetota bacterium]|jgi:hypothetical protein